MIFEHVNSKLTLPGRLSGPSLKEFIVQLEGLLDESKGVERIVYVWRASQNIPRLRGESSVIYIGKTKWSLYDRYQRELRAETERFWERYDHILTHFGSIVIDIYRTNVPKISENDFLYQYHRKHLETPPLNTQNYKDSLLDPKIKS